MSKTPEEMAEEYADLCVSDAYYAPLKAGFLAGYQAAKDTYKDAISAYEDVAKQMLEEAVRIMSPAVRIMSPKDQLADTSKVMSKMEQFAEVLYADMPMAKKAFLRGYRETNARLLVSSSQWISVKKRLPRPGQKVLAFDNGIMRVQAISDHGTWHPYVNGARCNPSHWMELPASPEDSKT